MGRFASGLGKLHSEMDEPHGVCGFIDLSNYFGGCRNDLSSPTVTQAYTVVVFFPPPKETEKNPNQP